jgi:hypothetical protein
MSAMQKPAPNHQSETFGSGQTQFFEWEALSVDHPEIRARERARQQLLQLSNPTEKQARPQRTGNRKETCSSIDLPISIELHALFLVTFGFMHEANLDEGAMWPTAFALKELTAAEEARIGALVKKAVS